MRTLGLSLSVVALLTACGKSDDPSGDSTTSDTGEEESSGSESDTGTGSSSDGPGDDTDDSSSGPIFDVGGDGDGDGDGPPLFPTTCEEALTSKTSVGCIFYPAALVGTQPSTGFAVSNVTDQVATVTLSDINGQVDQVMVDPGQIHMFIDNGAHKMATQTHQGDDGYVIESDQPLQVFQFMPPNGVVTADASIVLPAQALGTKHRVVTYNAMNSPQQYAAVVATEDGTTVTFTLEQPGSEVLAGGPIPQLDKDNGPDEAIVVLDRLETLVLSAASAHSMTMEINEFTGASIESDKPIAVYSGKYLANIPQGQCCADMIATAVPPTSVWGTNYAGVKFPAMGDEFDVWRFIAGDEGTEITLTGGVDQVIDLAPGEFADVETPEHFWASGTEPFAVVHFMVAGWFAVADPPIQPYDCPDPISAPGDPAMGWVYPQGNWLNRYLFPVGPTTGGEWCHDHATVVAPMNRWDEVTMDGGALPAATEIGQSGFGFAYVQLPNPFHEILAPNDVGVEVSVYGYVHNGSYFYPGGMGLQELNPEG